MSRFSTLRKVDTTLLDTIISDVVSEIRKTLIEEASMGTTPVTTTDDVVSKMRLEMREMMKEMVSSIVDIAKGTASTSTGYGLSKRLEKEAEEIAKSIKVEPWEGPKKTSWNVIRLEVFTNAHNY